MTRLAITAVLLAAFTIPAFAEDAAVKDQTQPAMNKAAVDKAVGKDPAATQYIVKGSNRDHDCMRHRAATLDMM